MKKEVLFIQGGGDGGYEADAQMVTSLREALGTGFELHYPKLETDKNVPDFGWLKQIGQELGRLNDGTLIVAHSLGASLLLKFLAENTPTKKIAGVFLLATPFWSGDEDWVQGLKLQPGFAQRLPDETPIFFYYCRDDREVPFSQLDEYKELILYENFREFETGGHQFDGQLNKVAAAIKSFAAVRSPS